TGHKEVFPQSKNGIACLAYSADGEWLASGAGDGTVRVWAKPRVGLRHVFQGHTERVTAVAFSPDGAWLVSGAADNTLRIYATKAGKDGTPKGEPQTSLAGMALSPDRKLVVTLDSPGGRLGLWDARTGKPTSPLVDAPANAAAAAFTPDGRTL